METTNPCGWPVTSAFDIRYILEDNIRCPCNEVRQDFATMRFNP